jgi:hypothetical protein
MEAGPADDIPDKSNLETASDDKHRSRTRRTKVYSALSSIKGKNCSLHHKGPSSWVTRMSRILMIGENCSEANIDGRHILRHIKVSTSRRLMSTIGFCHGNRSCLDLFFPLRLYAHQTDLLDRRPIYCHIIIRDSGS